MIKVNKFTSLVLGLAIALAGAFCYAECAFAQSMETPAACHSKTGEHTAPHEAGELCCPEFIALQNIQSSIHFYPETPSDFYLTTIHTLNLSQMPARQGDLYLPSDASPPRVFLLNFSIHAPPAIR